MADKLDIDQALMEMDPSTKELKATSYFEDYLFQFVNDLGGEGSTSAGDAFDLANLYQMLIGLPAKVSKIRKDLIEVEQSQGNVVNLNSKVSGQRKRIEDLDQQIPPILGVLTRLRAQIESLKVEVVNIATGTTAFTTSGNQLIFCNNTGALTITLNLTPKDGEKITVVRRDASVSLVGTLNGSTPTALPSKFDILDVYHTLAAGEWSA